MKKYLLFAFALLLLGSPLKAQTPQFVLVHNNTSSVFTTWDATYAQAVDGDNIYLPGVVIQSLISIEKRLYIYGAGHHPDSTNATGKTTVMNQVYIGSGASGGSIEGIQIPNYDFYFNYTNKKIKNYTIKRCKSNQIVFGHFSYPPDSLPTNVQVIENIFFVANGIGSTGNSFFKNLIRASCNGFYSANFKNNTFLESSYAGFISAYNSTFENNIFLYYPFSGQGSCTNIFRNNFLAIPTGTITYACPANSATEINTINTATISNLFVAFDPSFVNFPYLDNYRLKPTSPGKNVGTDGTDVGIYGTSSPTPAGWMPSNPHIYFKNIASQTNASGVLPIRIKVKASN